MQRHIRIHKKPTYFNIDGVEKISYPTWKRTLKQTLIPEYNVVLKPSCGTVEKPTSRKEKN